MNIIKIGDAILQDWLEWKYSGIPKQSVLIRDSELGSVEIKLTEKEATVCFYGELDYLHYIFNNGEDSNIPDNLSSIEEQEFVMKLVDDFLLKMSKLVVFI